MGLVAGLTLSLWSLTTSSASTPTSYTLLVAAVIAAAIATTPALPGVAAAGRGMGAGSLLHGVLALRVARLSLSLLRRSTLPRASSTSRGPGSAKCIATL